MIERFNFYDVFGFFIPGSVLLLLLWLPFGIVSRSLPPSDLASAVVAIIISYLTGHVLDSWANRAFPLAQGGRNPSSRLLDVGARLGVNRGHLARMLFREFHLDIDQTGDTADKNRDEAVLRARERIMARERPSYAEQFQGLYTMMRGVLAASLLGSLYLFGWIVRAPLSKPVGVALLALIGALLCLAMDLQFDDRGLDNRQRRRWEQLRAKSVAGLWCALALVSGIAIGSTRSIDATSLRLMVAAMFTSLIVGLQASGRYRYYSFEFVKAVFRAFVELYPERENDNGRPVFE